MAMPDELRYDLEDDTAWMAIWHRLPYDLVGDIISPIWHDEVGKL